MNCDKCKKMAVADNPKYCKEHFIEYFENQVLETIKKYSLIKNKKEKICVAASGGKDSVALLHILHKHKFNIEALAIDEGINGYRDRSLEFLKKFCQDKKIKLTIKTYKKEIGKTTDQLSKKYKPACTVCGTFRRHLLDKHSKKYKKIATGHNLDDESQAILMNIYKAQKKLFARQGPITKEITEFTQKIKPFYFTKEKDIMIYAFLLGLNVDFEECPYAPLSFRAKVRDLLNEEETKNPGTKLNILKHYLTIKKDLQQHNELKKIEKCYLCGSPCTGMMCKVCRLKQEI
ncbi:TIGR00269 family protein [Candidatus Woesearchaeota archaeon]|nr:TIGR00269 family protein [Candidatus Woesearchaeota archaeon]